MSNIHRIGNPAETASRSRPAVPPHPLLQAAELDVSACRDGLNNCAATLCLLADLFGNADMDRYPVLDSAAARRGMFLQLYGVADTIEAIEAFIGREAEEAREKRTTAE